MNEDLEPQSWLADQSVGAPFSPEMAVSSPSVEHPEEDSSFWDEAAAVCNALTFSERYTTQILRISPDNSQSHELKLTPARVEDLIMVSGISITETEHYELYKDARGKTLDSRYLKSEFRGTIERLVAPSSCVNNFLPQLPTRKATAMLIGSASRFDIGRFVLTGYRIGVAEGKYMMLDSVQFLCTKCDKVTDDRIGKTENTADVGPRPH